MAAVDSLPSLVGPNQLAHGAQMRQDEGAAGPSDVEGPLQVPLARLEVENYAFGDFKQCKPIHIPPFNFWISCELELTLVDSALVVRVPFYKHQIIKIGRDARSNFRFKNVAVSPVHCEIYTVLFDNSEMHPPLLYVRDCCSDTGTYVNGELVGKGPYLSKARLIKDNDTISVGPCSLRICDYIAPASGSALSSVQRRESSLFNDQFEITDTIIGHGAFANVHLATDVKTKQQVVCKVHDLAQLRKHKRPAVRRVDQEVSIWCQLDHPNIIAFRRAFRTKNTMFAFAELATGGDLFSLLEREKSLPEMEIKWIITQTVDAVKYLHCKGVAHRDIKPENILCTTTLHMSHRIALADFGCSAVTSRGRMTSNVGTDCYQAPEIRRASGAHTLAVDVWAVGILMLQLLAGNDVVEMPGQLYDAFQVEQLVGSVNLKRASKAHGPISPGGVAFLRMCLNLEPGARPSAAQAAKHTWLNEPEEERTLFKKRKRRAAWAPRDLIIPPIVDLRHDLRHGTKTAAVVDTENHASCFQTTQLAEDRGDVAAPVPDTGDALSIGAAAGSCESENSRQNNCKRTRQCAMRGESMLSDKRVQPETKRRLCTV